MQTLRSFHSKMEASKSTVQRPRRRALRKAPGELLPARVQKSYFMLSSPERDLLNTALEKFRPGLHEPVLVGALNQLKTALKLMSIYRLVIEEVQDARAITSYTRWIEALISGRCPSEFFCVTAFPLAAISMRRPAQLSRRNHDFKTAICDKFPRVQRSRAASRTYSDRLN